MHFHFGTIMAASIFLAGCNSSKPDYTYPDEKCIFVRYIGPEDIISEVTQHEELCPPSFMIPTGLYVHPSGFRYRIESEGVGPQPKQGDFLGIHYISWLMTGFPNGNSYNNWSSRLRQLGDAKPGGLRWAENEALSKLKLRGRMWAMLPDSHAPGGYKIYHYTVVAVRHKVFYPD